MTITTNTYERLERLTPDRDRVPTVAFFIYQGPHKANGGLESVTHLLTRFTQVRPVIVTDRGSPFVDRWKSNGIEVIEHEVRNFAAGRFGRLPRFIRDSRRVYRIINELGASVVHCNDIQSMRQVAPAAKAARVPIVFNLRNLKPPTAHYGWKWKVVNLADQVIVLSDEMRHGVVQRILTSGKKHPEVKRIYSIVNTMEFQEIRNEIRHRLGVGQSDFVIGCVGAFNSRKQQLPFLEKAVPRVLEQVPSATFYFLGDFDPERDEYSRLCQAVADRIAPDRINFVGFTNDVSDWYRAFDLTVVGSSHEGLARCMIESLSAGTPVVSFDVCSAREILQERQCGRVVRQGDYGAMVDSICELSGQDIRDELGHNAINTATSLFSAEKVVLEYEEAYLSLASEVERFGN